MEIMDRGQAKKLGIIALVFLGFYFLPADLGRIAGGLEESVLMTRDYAREHVLLCLVPAFFIAGAISVFIKSSAIIKYMGAAAPLIVAYSMGAISGTVLAVCSCTVLPIFVGIYMRGAGLGPAIAFLYSGPAINVIAISMTARVLGFELGLARTIAAISMSVLIGLIMAFLYRNEERERLEEIASIEVEEDAVDFWRILVLLVGLIGFLVFANFGHPGQTSGILYGIYAYKWYLAFGSLALVLFASIFLFQRKLLTDWMASTVEYTLLVSPYLLVGVVLAGFLLGRPGHEGLIPSAWIATLVGGSSYAASFFASFAGAFMYFATLTEVPILEGLIGSGMGKGPALALLLAGPALSLPSILVIASVLKWKKTITFVSLVIIISSLAGYFYGLFW